MSDDPHRNRFKHDIMNQLGIILGFSELLLEEMAAGDPRRGDVVEMHAAAERAMNLVARLEAAESEDRSEDGGA